MINSDLVHTLITLDNGQELVKHSRQWQIYQVTWWVIILIISMTPSVFCMFSYLIYSFVSDTQKESWFPTVGDIINLCLVQVYNSASVIVQPSSWWHLVCLWDCVSVESCKTAEKWNKKLESVNSVTKLESQVSRAFPVS